MVNFAKMGPNSFLHLHRDSLDDKHQVVGWVEVEVEVWVWVQYRYVLVWVWV